MPEGYVDWDPGIVADGIDQGLFPGTIESILRSFQTYVVPQVGDQPAIGIGNDGRGGSVWIWFYGYPSGRIRIAAVIRDSQSVENAIKEASR